MTRLLLILFLSTSLPLWSAHYTKMPVEVPVANGDTVAGYLLVPEGAFGRAFERASELGSPNDEEGSGMPAVVAMHDHGAWFTIGKEKLTSPQPSLEGREMIAEALAWVEKFYEGQFVADTLASRGFVVLVMDALGWGNRVQGTGKREKITDNRAIKAAQPEFYREYLERTGRVWFEKILADDKACVTYLMNLPYVDKTRVGVWGFSMGAYRAWQLAAEDERVAWCAAANWMTTRSERGKNIEDGRSWQLPDVSAYSMYRPSMDSVDYPEIVAKIAPRPMLLQYGTKDRLFPDPVLRDGQWEALVVQGIEREHRFTREHMKGLLEWLEGK